MGETGVTIIEKRSVGRPRKNTAMLPLVADAERLAAQHITELVNAALEMALERKPESCPYHHEVLSCAHVTEQPGKRLRLVQDDEDDEPTASPGVPCKVTSKGQLRNPDMIRYLIDRVAGKPMPGGTKVVQFEFVQRVAQSVVAAFGAINGLPSSEERMQAFAVRMSEMWAELADEEGAA